MSLSHLAPYIPCVRFRSVWIAMANGAQTCTNLSTIIAHRLIQQCQLVPNKIGSKYSRWEQTGKRQTVHQTAPEAEVAGLRESEKSGKFWFLPNVCKSHRDAVRHLRTKNMKEDITNLNNNAKNSMLASSVSSCGFRCPRYKIVLPVSVRYLLYCIE